MRRKKPIGIDLFSGAGGLSLGFEKAGFDIRLAVEKDKYAAETYKKNRRSKGLQVCIEDIKKLSPLALFKLSNIKAGQLDIIIGGPPCQGFSTSNMQSRTTKNPNNYYVFEFSKYIVKLKPKWFLMENVAGFSNFQNGEFKDKIINKLKRNGYLVKSIILNSSDFGVPQSRNRIFIVGNNQNIPLDFVGELADVVHKKPLTALEAISDLASLGNGHAISEVKYKFKTPHNDYQRLMRNKTNGVVCNNLVTKHTSTALKRFDAIREGENLQSLARRKPELILNYKDISKCHQWVYLRLPSNKPSVAINNYRKNMLIHPTESRGLSVREAARLQSFPDHYIFYGPLGYQQQQVANAVPPLLAKAIGKAIKLKLTK